MNKRDKLKINIEAINEVLSNNANPEKLKLYSGFGDLKCVLLDTDKPEKFSKSEFDLIPYVKQLHETIKYHSKSDKEYKQYIDSIKTSVLTSFYTPDELVQTLNNLFEGQGLQFDRMLEPSAGNGVFLNIKANSYTAIEKDILTGKILKAQHPEKDVMINGFQEIPRIYENSFDIVTSNIPFGDFKVFDPLYSKSKNPEKKHASNSIHNYFFAKGLDQLREGGILAFITSTGVMDAEGGERFRQYLLQNANLVSAVRLPENTFQEAGTKVHSDLIILQKNSSRKHEPTEKEMAFFFSKRDENNIRCNSYYLENPEAIIHTGSKLDTDLYGKPGIRYTHKDGITGIAKDMERIISLDIQNNLDKKLFFANSTIIQKPEEKAKKTETVKPVQLSLFDDFDNYVQERKNTGKQKRTKTTAKPVQTSLFSEEDFREQGERTSTRSNAPKKPLNFNYTDETAKAGSLVLSEDKKHVGIANFDNTATIINADNPNLLKNYVELRRSYFSLKLFEKDFQEEAPELRGKLNHEYDNFKLLYGTLTENNSILLNDPAFLELQGLEYYENGEFKKADIFREPVDFVKEQERYTVEEALSKSRNQFNSVDIDYISKLAGLTTDEVIMKLEGDKIFYNPQSENYETPDTFLSGNVIKKMDYAMGVFEASNRSNRQLLNSIIALEGVIPSKVQFEDIGLQLGERWIPDQYYSEFASQVIRSELKVNYNSSLDDFILSGKSSFYANEKYGVKSHNRNYNATDVLRFAFRNNTPEMNMKVYRDGVETTIPDTEGIQKMNTAVDTLRKDFEQWCNSLSQDKKDILENLYNRLFNCFVPPKRNGDFQTFPGLNHENLGIKDLYPSQKDAVLMIKDQNGGLIDHEVGGGKTLIMCTAAHELKRLGMANKPCILCMKANVSQVAETYKKAYPEAKILYATPKDFKKENREALFSKIQNNNWDCIIMTHDQFKTIPQSLEVQKQIIDEQIKAIESVLYSNSDTDKYTEKSLIKMKENLIARLDGVLYDMNEKKGNSIDFQTMGIDHLFVDESHEFKNLMFQTKHNRVAGIGNSKGSERAFNLLLSARTIQNKNDKDFGLTLLSGTPLSNSLTELYNIFQILCPRALKEQGIESFDAWVNTYALKTKEFEFSVTNDIISKERFRHFIKVPELATFYNQITDYKSAEMIGVVRPEKNEILITAEQTPQQENMFQRLKEFAKTGNGEVIFREPLSHSEQNAKMLIATNTAKKASLDMQLIDPMFGDEPENKANIASEKIFDYYQKYDFCKGTQFVFCDLGTYKPGNEFNIYSKIKEKLIEKGIPTQEIQFIQQYDTDGKRQKLFDRTNNGDVRILFGSTKMLGTGVNAQERCVAIHHLDIPWTPKDLEQRDGRGARKGNWVAQKYCDNKVDSIIYATKGTLDTYKFNLLKNKALFISQLKRNDLSVRTLDEGSMDKNSGMNFAEYIAVLSGNNDLLEKTKLEKIITQLRSEEITFNKKVREKENTTFSLTVKKSENEKIIGLLKEDFNKFMVAPHDITISGKKLSDPVKIGEELNKIIGQPNSDTKNYQKIGQFGDFNIVIKAEQYFSENAKIKYQNKIYIEGNLKYSRNNGTLAQTPKLAGEYHIKAMNRIPEIIKQHEEKNIEINDKLKDLNSLELTWGKRDELKSYIEKHAELTKRIEDSISNSSTQKEESKQDLAVKR